MNTINSWASDDVNDKGDYLIIEYLPFKEKAMFAIAKHSILNGAFNITLNKEQIKDLIDVLQLYL